MYTHYEGGFVNCTAGHGCSMAAIYSTGGGGNYTFTLWHSIACCSYVVIIIIASRVLLST